jgi:hypothetical protein
MGQFCKGYDTELCCTPQEAASMVATVAGDDAMKCAPRQIGHTKPNKPHGFKTIW